MAQRRFDLSRTCNAVKSLLVQTYSNLTHTANIGGGFSLPPSVVIP